MKKNITLIALFLSSFFYQKSFSQVIYPCGVYYLGLNGTTDYGAWSKVYPTNDFTLAAWVQITDPVWQGKEMDIFQRSVGGIGNQDGLDLYIAVDGTFKFRAYTFKNGVPTLDSLSTGIKPDPKKWYHVAVTFQSSGNCNIYINGNLASSKSFGGAMSLNYPYLDYLAIGCKVIYPGGYKIVTFKGYLDELAVAEKALTQDQIKTLANGLTAGDPFFVANSVDSYDKEDTYPARTNLGIGGGSVAITGQLYYCNYKPPIANAGPDQTITLPITTVTLSGSVTLGTGTIAKAVWSKESGPAGGNISDPGSQTPVITSLQEGTYIFKLTLTDNNGYVGTDEVSIIVNTSGFVTISGTIKYIADGSLVPNPDISIKPFEGVTVKASGTTSSSVTNISGFYFLVVPSGYSGTITASSELTALTPPENDPRFIPSSKTFNNVTADQTQDFTFDPTLAVPLFITSPLATPVLPLSFSNPILQNHYDISVPCPQPNNRLTTTIYQWFFNQHGDCPTTITPHGEFTGIGDNFRPNTKADDRFAWDCNLNKPTTDLDKGQYVYAVADGEISNDFIGWNFIGGQGVNQVLIKHTNGKLVWYSGYYHMDPVIISRDLGTPVKKGDRIGKVGAKGTWNPNNPINNRNYPVNHLHFVVYYKDPVISTKLRSVERNFSPYFVPATEEYFHFAGSIVSGAQVMIKRDSVWSEYGRSDENGNLKVLFMPAVKKGDSIRISAAGYEEMTLPVDSSANISNNFIVPLIPTSNPSLRIKYPSVVSLDQKAFYNNPTVHLKITGQNFSRYDVIKETDLGDTLITVKTFADNLRNDSLVNINLTDTGSNTYRFVFKGLDTIELYKNFDYQPGTSGFYDVTLKVPGIIYGSELYVDGAFVKNLTNANEILSLLNGEHFLNVKANGYKDTTIKATTAAAYNLSLVPESYGQPDSIVFNFPANGKIQYHKNVTALDSAMQTVVSLKQIIDNFSGKGLIPKSRKFEFRHLNTSWSRIRLVTVLDQQERLSNDSVYLMRIYNDTSFTKIPFSDNEVRAKYDSAEQKLSYDFIDFNKGIALKEALVIMKKQAPIVKGFSNLTINADTSLSILLNKIFADPDSIRNDLTYRLLDTIPTGLHLSLVGDSIVINAERSYTGTTRITITAEHDGLLATKIISVTIVSGSLPITLLNFSGTFFQSDVHLNWQTSQEINTSHFIIERSLDGNIFSSIGRVSASGNSSASISYSFADLQPIQGKNFYRLKMVDQDGKFTYSNVIAIRLNEKSKKFQVFPNPANEVLNVRASGNNETATLQIVDASGRKLKEKKINLNGNTSFSIDIKDLPKGVYTILFKSKVDNDHQSFIKQ